MLTVEEPTQDWRGPHCHRGTAAQERQAQVRFVHGSPGHGVPGPWALAGHRIGLHALEKLERKRGQVWGVRFVHRCPQEVRYTCMVDGLQADLTNAPEGGYAGAITAALFLEHFATPAKGKPVPWAHVDLMAWNLKTRPGRPMGGEAMGLRAMAAMILARFQSGPVKPAAAKPRRPRRAVAAARPAKPARKAR